MSDRRARLATALAGVRGRVARACAAVGRSPEEVTLLAVTKTYPASDVALLVDLGLDAFGESRPQEAAAKLAELSALRPAATVRWHLVGRLQRNKTRSVATWAARVESLDSERLAGALGTAAARAIELGERAGPLPVLLQVSLDGDPDRGGVPVAGLPALAARVAGLAALRVHGVMAVAPLGWEPARAFGELAAAAARLRVEHPDAAVISAGMSGDLEDAIRHGSTCVRVGAALLGERQLISR